MVVLHELESALDHGVLEVARTFEGSDLARKMLPNPEMLRSPADKLSRSNQPGCHSTNRSFTRPLRPQQMTSMLRERSKQRSIGAAICMRSSMETIGPLIN